MVKKLDKVDKEVHAEAVDMMTEATDKLEEEVVKRMPVDEGFLEKSVKKKITKGKLVREVMGRVYIAVNSAAADYAMYMHEMKYNLGARSKAKQDASPDVTVGRKYMARALSENARAFGLFFVKKLKEILR
jgi:hypothetical protein